MDCTDISLPDIDTDDNNPMGAHARRVRTSLGRRRRRRLLRPVFGSSKLMSAQFIQSVQSSPINSMNVMQSQCHLKELVYATVILAPSECGKPGVGATVVPPISSEFGPGFGYDH